jgi:hypothetical protein
MKIPNSAANDGDIAKEPYQGPGRIVASAGYMYLSHLAAMLVGFVTLGAVGAIAHQRTHAIKQWADGLMRNGHDATGITKFTARIITFVSGIAKRAAHGLFTGFQRLMGQRTNGHVMGEDKAAAFLFAGGFGAVIGYVGSSIWGILKGSAHGDQGRRQFERAQMEIKHLRALNDDLRPSQETSVPSAATRELPSTKGAAHQHQGTVIPSVAHEHVSR